MPLLNDILKNKKEEIAGKKIDIPVSMLEKQPRLEKRSFKEALSEKGLSIIAEMKRMSPSAGLLRDSFHPESIARMYEKNGAQAISVLTDEKYFGGQNEHLIKAKTSVTLPFLRKDFIIDDYQIHEAFFIGADAILLIVRILSFSRLHDYLALARALNLDCLVEVHSAFEMEIALKAEANIIGINNRNLDSLKIDLKTSLALRPMIPNNCVTVSESGIRTSEDVKRMTDAGFDAILVGEALMSSSDSGSTLQRFLTRGEDKG